MPGTLPATESFQKGEPVPRLRNIFSWLIYCLALCTVPATLYLTYLWIEIVHFKDGIGFIVFTRLLAPVTLAISLILIMVPSLIEYRRSRARRDIQSFWLSVLSAVMSIVEPVAMFVVLNGQRLHGPGG
jgi:hypothetical protein